MMMMMMMMMMIIIIIIIILLLLLLLLLVLYHINIMLFRKLIQCSFIKMDLEHQTQLILDMKVKVI